VTVVSLLVQGEQHGLSAWEMMREAMAVFAPGSIWGRQNLRLAALGGNAGVTRRIDPGIWGRSAHSATRESTALDLAYSCRTTPHSQSALVDFLNI
jgi:hypothetical protein